MKKMAKIVDEQNKKIQLTQDPGRSIKKCLMILKNQ